MGETEVEKCHFTKKYGRNRGREVPLFFLNYGKRVHNVVLSKSLKVIRLKELWRIYGRSKKILHNTNG